MPYDCYAVYAPLYNRSLVGLCTSVLRDNELTSYKVTGGSSIFSHSLCDGRQIR